MCAYASLTSFYNFSRAFTHAATQIAEHKILLEQLQMQKSSTFIPPSHFFV
jgi:hypothetical protein